MSAATPIRPEKLITIPQWARLKKVHRATAFRQVTAIHAIDRANGRGGWLIVMPGRGRNRMRINLAFLKREHPEHFEQEMVQRGEFADLVERVEELEGAMKREKQDGTAMAVSIRRIRYDVNQLQVVADSRRKSP
jgi:hypothetical protein